MEERKAEPPVPGDGTEPWHDERGCFCRLCIRHARFLELMSRLPSQGDRMFLLEISETLDCAEMDLEHEHWLRSDEGRAFLEEEDRKTLREVINGTYFL